MSEEQDQKDQPKLNLRATDPICAHFNQLGKTPHKSCYGHNAQLRAWKSIPIRAQVWDQKF